LRIVIAHLGGALPMLLQRLDNQMPRAFPELPERPSLAARRMWYDTVSHGHAPALLAAQQSLGADRLVLGTDFPYVRGEHYRGSVEYVRRAGFDPAETAAILDTAGADVLGLGASGSTVRASRTPGASDG
jgi:aminocarboxymuconate-semialdehyde decarboxylase